MFLQFPNIVADLVYIICIILFKIQGTGCFEKKFFFFGFRQFFVLIRRLKRFLSIQACADPKIVILYLGLKLSSTNYHQIFKAIKMKNEAVLDQKIVVAPWQNVPRRL